MNATKDKFFSIISHDLKNPAVAQREALQMLFDKASGWDAATLREYYGELLQSADHQVKLLYNLLGWAQLQTGRMTCRPARFDLARQLRSEIAVVGKMATGKGVALQTDMPGELPVTGDANMLSTVVRNLLTNAVKYTASGGVVTLDVSPHDCRDVAGNVATGYAVSISDTGIGMSREQISNLFRLGSLPAHPGTAGETGSGLGLIVCRELLEKHGTTLNVESTEGEGSRFWFEVKIEN
jgi:signal transduction histidine kinase